MNDLERLVAIEDVRGLQSRYVRLADLKEWSALAGLFLPDAEFIAHDVNGEPQATMRGREEIERRVSATVGGGTVLHHLFSYEIAVDSPTKARGVWAMEDWIDRSEVDPTPHESTGRTEQFVKMHGCGHYHVAYEKVGGTWFIAGLKLLRLKLEFTY